MDAPHQDPEVALEAMLHRSDELHEKVLHLLEGAGFLTTSRGEAAFGMCSVALEHATSIRALMAIGLPISAVSLMRLQFEALARAMWLLYAAGDAAIEKLIAPLTLEAEQAANGLPSVNDMIKQIGGCVGKSVPAAAHQMLVQFKEVSWRSLNSFVHGGIHPLRRSADGFPVSLLLQVLRSSNGLFTMTGMVLAILSGDGRITRPVGRIQSEFKDCLPDLLM